MAQYNYKTVTRKILADLYTPAVSCTHLTLPTT